MQRSFLHPIQFIQYAANLDISRRYGSLRPPKNEVHKRIYDALLSGKHQADQFDKIIELFTFRNLLAYQPYKLKRWVWEKRTKKA